MNGHPYGYSPIWTLPDMEILTNRDIHPYRTFSQADGHPHGTFTRMGSSLICDVHPYGTFTNMGRSPIWGFHPYGTFIHIVH